MQDTITDRSGIPTYYRYVRFRSRTEARWAVLFDAIGLTWVFEPYDFDHYVADFGLLQHQSLLAEIKPGLSVEELLSCCEKMLAGISHIWRDDVVVLGGTPFPRPLDGPLAPGVAVAGLWLHLTFASEERWSWSAKNAVWAECIGCGQIEIRSLPDVAPCMRCGDDLGGRRLSPSGRLKIEEYWGAACQRTQWGPECSWEPTPDMPVSLSVLQGDRGDFSHISVEEAVQCAGSGHSRPLGFGRIVQRNGVSQVIEICTYCGLKVNTPKYRGRFLPHRDHPECESYPIARRYLPKT